MSLPSLLEHSAVRYLAVGGASFVFNVFLLNVFREGFDWPTGVSAMLAFWATFGFSFAAQRIIAFGARSSVVGSLMRYSILVAVNSLVVSGIVILAHDIAGLGLGTSQLIATATTTIWNYFAYKYWVYSPKKAPAAREQLNAEVQA